MRHSARWLPIAISLIVVGLVLGQLAPLASSRLRAASNTYGLEAGDKLDVTCSTTLQGEVKSNAASLSCAANPTAVNPTAAVNSVPLRIDAAGSGIVAADGTAWIADTGFDGGLTVDRGNISIANTANPRLYQTERYSMSRYRLPVPNGRYTVRLHFAETYEGITGPGQRVFSMYVEDMNIPDLDIFAESGGRNNALIKQVDATVNDGMLDISFIKQVENPEINAIEVLPIGSVVAAPTAAPTAAPAAPTAAPAAPTAAPTNAPAAPTSAPAATAVPTSESAYPAPPAYPGPVGEPMPTPVSTVAPQPSPVVTAVPQPSPTPPTAPTPTTAPQAPVPTTAPVAAATVKFTTLPPNAQLPSDDECAQRVRRSNWEPRPENASANRTVPVRGNDYTYSSDGMAAIVGGNDTQIKRLIDRVNGNFTGTTDEIIQWGACKWGFNEDIVRAVAVQESDWRMSTVGDGGVSFGLLQVKSTDFRGTAPATQNSTAFNVDFTLAVRRSCYEGYITWLNNGYQAGDEWGCVGTWFSGKWYDAGAKNYISSVQKWLDKRVWEQPGF